MGKGRHGDGVDVVRAVAVGIGCVGTLVCLAGARSDRPLWSHEAPGELGLVAGQCVEVTGAATVETTRARNLFERRLTRLLDPALDDDTRRRIAVYSLARVFLRRAQDKAAVFDRVERDMATGRLDKTVSALYDLEQLVLFTAQLRNRRADLTRIRFGKDGAPILTVRSPPTAPGLEVVTARAVAGMLESASALGWDCTRSALYARAKALAGERSSVSIDVIRQTDLQRLYTAVDRAQRACVAGVARGDAFLADIGAVTPGQLQRLQEETRTAFSKAERVLALAVDLYGGWLDEHLPGGIPERHTAVSSGQGDVAVARETPAPSPAAVPTKGSPAPSPEPERVRGEAARDAFVAEIARQVQVLRRQQGGEAGGLATHPAGSANNLHIRMKRLYHIAAVNAGEGGRDGTFKTSLADGAVEVTFERREGRLTHIAAVVTERFPGGVTLAWYVALTRRSDLDFTLESGIGGIGAYMEVQKGAPIRFPNYQQIIILMNRLDQLVEGGRAGRGPVVGPTE